MSEMDEVKRRFFWNMTPCSIADRFRLFGGMASVALKREGSILP
jgi:hypothetical protein